MYDSLLHRPKYLPCRAGFIYQLEYIKKFYSVHLLIIRYPWSKSLRLTTRVKGILLNNDLMFNLSHLSDFTVSISVVCINFLNL